MAKINLGGGGSKVGTIQSVLSGIGAGLIDIPKGAFSLGAALVDLGAGTNSAAQVENWFDNLTTLDEAAEATTAGKITRIIANLGVPGTVAFKAGSRLAKKALNAKKSNTFFHITKDMDNKLQKTLNAKGKMLTTLGGVGGVAVSDAIFVGDAQQVGTLGDAFNFGPTQLSNDANNSSALIMNRIRFGADSAMLGSIIGGTGNAIGQAIKRSDKLKRNNDFIDKILDNLLPQGRQTKEGFELSREFKGIRSADLDKVQRIQRQTDKLIDANYGLISKATGFGVKKERELITKKVHEALVSTSKAGPTVEDVFDDAGKLIGGKFSLGDMNPKALDELRKIKTGNGKSLDTDAIEQNLIKIRKIMEGSFSAIGSNMLKYGDSSGAKAYGDDLLGDTGAWSQYKKRFKTKTQDWMNGTYRIFPNSSANAMKAFKPTTEAMDNTVKLFENASYTKERNIALAAGKTEAQAAQIAGNINHNNVALLAVDNLLKGSKGGKFITEGVSSPYLYDEEGLIYGTMVNKDLFEAAEELVESSALKGKTAVGDLADGTKARVPLNQLMDTPVEGISVDKLSPRKIIEDLFGKVEDPAVTMLTKINQLSVIRRSHEYFDNIYQTLGAKVVKNADGTEKLKGQIFDNRADAVEAFGLENVGDAISMRDKTGAGGSLFVDALNPLEGKFTSKGMKEALEGTRKGLLDFTVEGGMGAALYTNLILYPKATAQLAKTVLSPITHARNLISAGAFAAANGIIPLMNTEARAEALKTIGNIATLGTEEGAKRLRELQRLGVINKSARIGDVEELLADSNFGAWAGQQRALEGILNPLKKLKEISTDAYQTEDDFWKVFTFTAERQRIEKALINSGLDVQVFARDAKNDLGRAFKSDAAGNAGDKYLDEAAASIVRNNIPNYDYVNNMVKEIRRLPLGNFVSFPAEIMRTSVNILKKGFAENNYSYNGVKPFKSIGLQRLLGFGATTVAVPFGTVEAFKAIYNVSGMEMDALRRFVPDWSKNSTIVPIKDEQGNFKYVDFSHANAYDTMIRPFQTIMNAVADGRTDTDTVMEDVVQGVFTSTKELGQPFISESLWTASLGDIFLREGQTRDGKRLYTDQTPTGDKVAKIVEHLANSQLPGGINIKDGNITGSYIRFKNAITKNPDTYGRTYELSDEALGIAGMRAVAIDPVSSMKYKIADFTRGVSNARREFTSPLLKGGPVSAEEIVDRYKKANQALFQVQKNMSQDYFGALVLGADNQSLNREFKDRISKVQMSNLKKGKFKPFLPSENIQNSFAANAKKINAPNTYLEAKAVINEMARQLNKVRLFDDTFPQLTNPFSGQNTFLPTANLSSTLPNLNLGLTTPASGTGSSGNNLNKGRQVFGPNDTIFGG